jgi:hypothetical protein
VTTRGEPSVFEFIGQNGVVRKTVPDSLTASYDFAPTDTYIRTAIRAPRTTMYLNPVVRYDGVLPRPAATVDPLKTSVLRVIFAVAAVGGIGLMLYRRRKLVSGRVREVESPDSPTH